MTNTLTRRRRSNGFTLIELLTVICILSVLLVLALPNYANHQRRAHRAQARAALLNAAQWMERAATANGQYPNTAAIPTTLLEVPGRRYTVKIESPDPHQTGTATYRITATRNPQSAQQNDECGDYVLDQANRRTVLHTQADAATCWSR